ncbi:MAG: pyridoxine 5'-phosphate synthase [Desulfobacteraceae bacterium 4572_35.1]|nr:MAG: pyridoxine 5'-phosphate synthase [Desulfobacteraceae bacterium 4572_35.1]
MARLGVNIDHVATVRQARGTMSPDPVAAAAIAELAGADGITVHLREDRRHIQDRDVELLRRTVQTSLNLEMACTDEIVAIANKLRPDCVTLVPEKRQELTTEGGLNVVGAALSLGRHIESMQENGIVVSLFIDPDLEQIDAAMQLGADAIEIHTGSYCDAPSRGARQAELVKVQTAIHAARQAGIAVNAGHGLNYNNIIPVVALGGIDEFNIGHSIIARAVLVGLERAVREMKELLAG